MTVAQVGAGRDACRAERLAEVADRGTWQFKLSVERWNDPDKLAWAERRAAAVLREPSSLDLAWLAQANRLALRGELDAQARLGAILLRPHGVPLSGDQLQLLIAPDEVTEHSTNLLCNAGIARMLDLLIGAGGQAFTNTYTRLGAGNGVGSAAAADTDMSAAAGSANRWYQAMDATYPSRASQTMTGRGTFAAADGNFAWNEMGFDLGGAGTSTSGAVVGAPLLNHKTGIAQGTKASPQVWVLTATVTLS